MLPALSLNLSRVRTEDLANRYQIEQKRLEVRKRSEEAQLAAQQARNSQLQALLKLKQEQVQNLRVAAGTSGVLQQMTAEEGQQVVPGTNLARVVEPQHLKAELKIAETQVKDIQIGQRAQIDTRNGIIPGHVSRMDPAAQQGTFTVDVALEGALPPGAAPDLTVDGTVELERLDDVIYISRPAFGQAQSTIKMFKLDDDDKTATRVQVKLGRSSVSAMEILEGLQPGDRWCVVAMRWRQAYEDGVYAPVVLASLPFYFALWPTINHVNYPDGKRIGAKHGGNGSMHLFDIGTIQTTKDSHGIPPMVIIAR